MDRASHSPRVGRLEARGHVGRGGIDFYSAAIALGVSPAKADDLNVTLTIRTMRARGAI